MLNRRFIWRQLTSTRKQAVVFVLCVALSMITLVALRGFGASVNRALLRDAQKLHAADIIIESNYGLSAPLQTEIERLVVDGQAQRANLWEFYSVVRVADGEDSILSNIKVVEPDYPFYGEVSLASGRAFSDVLTRGNAIVEQALLERLGASLGDPLRVGETTLLIADVVTHEPDRPVDFFSLGPRLFVAADDLGALDLVRAGSRVNYKTLLAVAEPRQLDAVAARLQAVRDVEQEDVQTYRTAQSGVQRFFDNFLFFLNLVGVFTLLLAGIGIQSALTAFLRERHGTIAIVKTLGATRRFVTLHFIATAGLLGALGALIGLAAGFGLQAIFPLLLRGFLPPDVELTISAQAVAESLLLGAVVVASFTFLPIAQLEQLKPAYIFRKEMPATRMGRSTVATVLAVLLTFTGMVIWLLGEVETALYFVGGMLALIALAGLLTEGTLRVLRGRRIKRLALRQALRGLFRPRNATRSIIITLSASLGVIFCIYLVEQNLDAAYVEAYPDDAPNVFFLDIQPDQVAAFAAQLEMEADYYPVVRGTISAINGEPRRRRDDAENGRGRNWQFNLTYRDQLLADEAVVGGGPMYDPGLDGPQVSILDDVQEFMEVDVGDRITFRIQGVPLEATVASIRTRREESVELFFSFVFPPEVLQDAPQTIFTALSLEADEIAPLQNRMTRDFPNVSVIDVTAAIESFAAVAQRLSQVIRFFMLFSIAAGLLIVVSSVFATRFARTQEAVYYKVLGAKNRFVLRTFTLENGLLGLLSATLALLMAQVGSWAIDTQIFEIVHRPLLGASLAMGGVTVLLVTVVGLLASVSILRSRPIVFLREQTEEE